MTTRQDAVEYVGRKLRLGWSKLTLSQVTSCRNRSLRLDTSPSTSMTSMTTGRPVNGGRFFKLLALTLRKPPNKQETRP